MIFPQKCQVPVGRPDATEIELILQEFIAELEGVSRDFAWGIGRGGRIWGSYVDGYGGELFDPVTAVCFARTRKLYRPEEGIQAAREISLSPIDYGDIIAASNNVWSRVPRPDRYGQALRERLLDVLGVSRANWFYLCAARFARPKRVLGGFFSRISSRRGGIH